MFKKHSSPKQCEECSLDRERPVRILLQKSRTLIGKGDSIFQSSGRKTNFLQGFNVDKFMKRLFTEMWAQLRVPSRECARGKKQKENELSSVRSSLSCWCLPLGTPYPPGGKQAGRTQVMQPTAAASENQRAEKGGKDWTSMRQEDKTLTDGEHAPDFRDT